MLKHMACCIVIGAATAGASAQTNIQANPGSGGYMQDGRAIVARSQYGLCWRSGSWTPGDAIPGCDGELVPPVTKPTAPDIVAPPPTPVAVPGGDPAAAPALPLAARRCDFIVTLQSDQTFNKAELSTAARKRIDDEALAKLASCAKIDLIRVTAYTDQLGPEQRNQKLSEQRANMVAAYLKSKGAAAPIEAHGAGAVRPVKSCNGSTSRAELVQCLAPNRRITIEARGTAR